MNSNVILMAEFSIKSSELDNFKALVKEMVEATQANEPDTHHIRDFHQRRWEELPTHGAICGLSCGNDAFGKFRKEVWRSTVGIFGAERVQGLWQSKR